MHFQSMKKSVIYYKFKGDFKVATDVSKVPIVNCPYVTNTTGCIYNCKILLQKGGSISKFGTISFRKKIRIHGKKRM